MSLDELRNRGDRFAFLFGAIFLFVHLGIVLPARGRSSLQTKILAAQEKLSERQRSLQRLMKERQGATERTSPAPLIDDDVTAVLRQTTEADSGNGVDVMEKELLELQLKDLELEEKLEQDKEFSLPVFGIGIGQKAVLVLYPTFVFLGILGLLRYRKEYLDLADASKEVAFPVWTLPIAWARKDRPAILWITLNALALFTYLALFYVTLDFMRWEMLGPSRWPSIRAVHVLFAVASASAFLLSLTAEIYREARDI